MARSIEELVEHQVRRWLEEREIASRRSQPPAHEAQHPMISISREFGARGAEIGKLVAERLGFRFYAQEIVHEVAHRAHVRQRVVESVDERLQSRIAHFIDEMVEGRLFAPSDYLRNLSQVIITLGRHGNGVIVGRGSQVILDPALTLRVRCYAPLETRIADVARRESIGKASARAEVLRVDSERVAFYRQHFNADVTSPLLYDLLLNTSTLGVEASAELVRDAFHRRFA